MVLVDEAFSKMDEGRSTEVINYLTGALGLQLIFIMPSSKCGLFMSRRVWILWRGLSDDHYRQTVYTEL